MALLELIEALKHHDIKLSLTDKEVRISAPWFVSMERVKTAIKQHQAAIEDMIRSQQKETAS